MKKTITIWHRWYRIKRNLNQAALPSHDIACPCCASSVTLPDLVQGEKADCPRCGYGLVHVERNPFHFPIAYALTVIILLAWILLANYMSVSIVGPEQVLTMPEMIKNLWQKDFKIISIVMFLMIFGLPFAFAILNLKIFISLIIKRPSPTLQMATKICILARPWMMHDVFFIAGVVALVKIQAMASISFHAAFLFIFSVMLIITRINLHSPQHWLYAKLASISKHNPNFEKNSNNMISCVECYFYQPKHLTHCQICNSKIHKRKPRSLEWATSLLIAATILYIPANILPIMVTSSVIAGNLNSTIFDGIVLMWEDHDYFVAGIIFTASIFVPIAKIISMYILIFSARYKLLASPLILSKLYHAVELVGRWSMIDVFVIIILMSSFATPLANVMPGSATVYFLWVVILTMLSANCFDTRLLWDKYEQEQQNKLEPIKK